MVLKGPFERELGKSSRAATAQATGHAIWAAPSQLQLCRGLDMVSWQRGPLRAVSASVIVSVSLRVVREVSIARGEPVRVRTAENLYLRDWGVWWIVMSYNGIIRDF